MTATPERLAQLSSDQWDRLEAAVARFEEAWESGSAPTIEDFLPDDEPARRHTLVELLHADLEYRLKSRQPARVEDYLDRYPMIAHDPQAVVGLILREHELRRRSVIGLSPEDLLERFPAYREELLVRLRPAQEAEPAPSPVVQPPPVDARPPVDAYVDPMPTVDVSRRERRWSLPPEGALVAPRRNGSGQQGARSSGTAQGSPERREVRASRSGWWLALAGAAVAVLGLAVALVVRSSATDSKEPIATDRPEQSSVQVLESPSFAGHDAVFPAGAVRVVEGRLEAGSGSPTVTLSLLANGEQASVDAEFASPHWEQAAEVGLALSATGPQGYVVRLVPSGQRADTSNRAATMRRLQIVRSGIVLRERSVAAELGASLRLTARREGERLSATLNDGPVLHVVDPFPLDPPEPGVIGVVGLSAAPLLRLSVSRGPLFAEPNVLRDADRLYDRGEHEHALAAYRTAAGRAARYKSALCLTALGRGPEAVAVYSELAEGTDRWALLADCRLWLMTSDRARSDAILDRLAGRDVPPIQAAALAPEEMRRRLLNGAPRPTGLELLLTDPAELVRHQELRGAAVRRIEMLDDGATHRMQEELLQAYRLAGREADAVRLAGEMLAGSSDLTDADFIGRIVEQQCWALRRLGRPEEALEAVNRWLGRAPDLLLERARVQSQLGRWDAAEADVDTLLRRARPPLPRTVAAEAALLKGFLRARRDDEEGAYAAWKTGAHFGRAAVDAGSSWLTAAAIAGLADARNDVELRRLRERFVAWCGRGCEGLVSGVPLDAMHSVWQTPRGRELARRWAFRDLTALGAARQPVLVLAAHALGQHALGDTVTPEQDRLIWDLVQSIHGSQLSGRFRLDAAEWGRLTLVIHGTSFLWTELRPRLDPAVRGPLAYVLGARYARLDRPREAAEFFRAALEEAPADGPLARLAQAGLDAAPKQR